MSVKIGYPSRKRSTAVDKAFPGKSRTVARDGVMDAPTPSMHGSPKDGKTPKKGVLKSGGGHG